MRVAYADPPYIGQAKRHYSHDARCCEVNHRVLIGTLEANYDAWALSCSSPSLRQILAMCPDGVRIGSWVKPFCSFKPNVNPAYAWEPVIYKIHRRPTRKQKTVRDYVAVNITLKRGLSGVKPEAFCMWLFDLLNMRPEDEFDDLFPGSGAVGDAHRKWKHQGKPTILPDLFESMYSAPLFNQPEPPHHTQ
jgi:hypothetical protein